MKNIQNNGNEKVTESIKELSESIINSKEVEALQKNQIIEQLTFLAEQVALPKNQQQNSVIEMVLKTVPVTLGTIASLSSLWTQCSHVIEEYFKTLK